MNIILIGYRTSGKSIVGRALAERLKNTFIDCDAYIEDRTKLSIAEIFERCGESYFRDLESQALAELVKQEGIVLATGGGAVMRHKNVQLFRRCGKVVFLRVSPETAFRRMVKDPKSARTRPALTDRQRFDEILGHIRARTPYYQRAADFEVTVDSHDVEGVVRQIVHYLVEL